MAHPSFILKKSKNDQFMFNLTAKNGQVILTSEMYTTKSSCENGIASVKTNSPMDERYERKTSSNGKPYFVLKAANHQIIGNSEMYESNQSMENGIESVKTNGPIAEVDDQS